MKDIYFRRKNAYEDKNKDERYIYSKNYEHNYDLDKKSKNNEDIDWGNEEENNSCNEYYRRCIMKRHASHNPSQIIYKTNKKTDFDEYQNLTMVINSPAKVIIYENEGDENKSYLNKSYTSIQSIKL